MLLYYCCYYFVLHYYTATATATATATVAAVGLLVGLQIAPQCMLAPYRVSASTAFPGVHVMYIFLDIETYRRNMLENVPYEVFKGFEYV